MASSAHGAGYQGLGFLERPPSKGDSASLPKKSSVTEQEKLQVLAWWWFSAAASRVLPYPGSTCGVAGDRRVHSSRGEGG